MVKPVSEQVIVIAGASSGIGLATALAAARRGAKLVLAARNGNALERAVAEIRREGGDAMAVVADLTRYDDARTLVAAALERHGRIDTFVNAVAVALYGTFAEVPLEDFRRTVEVDFFGQVHAAKAVLPHLERSEGALICIGSVLSDRGFPLQGAYSAAKHALKGWLDSLRLELLHAGSKVRVTLVKPSTMDTPLFEKARTYLGVVPKAIPPVYHPELVARAILRAAEGDHRDVYVGGAAKALSIAERLSPRLVDLQLRPGGWAFSAQRTHRAKSADAPNNLYEPVADDGGIRGKAENRVRATSIYQLATNHRIGAALAVAAGVIATGLLVRKLRTRVC